MRHDPPPFKLWTGAPLAGTSRTTQSLLVLKEGTWHGRRRITVVRDASLPRVRRRRQPACRSVSARIRGRIDTSLGGPDRSGAGMMLDTPGAGPTHLSL